MAVDTISPRFFRWFVYQNWFQEVSQSKLSNSFMLTLNDGYDRWQFGLISLFRNALWGLSFHNASNCVLAGFLTYAFLTISSFNSWWSAKKCLCICCLIIYAAGLYCIDCYSRFDWVKLRILPIALVCWPQGDNIEKLQF